MSGLLLPTCSIFFSSLMCFTYFMKKRAKIIENKMYSTMLIITLIDGILVTILQILAINGVHNNEMQFVIIFNKIDFLMLTTYANSLLLYIILITYKEARNNLKKITICFLIVDIFYILLIILSKVELIQKNTNIAASGLAVNITYILCAIYIISTIIIVLINIKKIDKRYIPIFAMILIIGLIFILFQINPYLIIISIALTLINYIMYFTIENPDVKMIEELELARNQADKANLAKTEFLSNMSHEIRTPLNAIVGFSECMIESENLNNEIKEYATDIVDASNNLLETVNGILDISKIEANKMEIIKKDYNPKETFKSLEKLILPRIKDKQIELKTYISEDLPGVLNGDVSKIKQIVINILTNAAKYTDIGEITYNVSCINNLKTKKCSLYISVKDTGRGIKKENINKLFNKFERMDEDKNTTIEGTGLGLAITKKLVEMLGGKINVFSIYGKGSNFTIYLEQDIINMEESKEEQKEAKINYDKFKNKKILIVDDSTINLKVAKQILKPYNFEIETVLSGFETIEKTKEKQYDLILMDIMMPKMDGVETLKKLKENENFKTPTVALTADAIEGQDAKYINEGFNDYLSKPINKEELNRVLNKYIN